jgi:formylglycine-generating enzyme required for sulfatase activity
MLQSAGGSLLMIGLCASAPALAQESAKDCALCPEMVIVPTGIAVLGAASWDSYQLADELPERTFYISTPFAVSRHEITRAQFDVFVTATQRDVGGNCLSDRKRRGDWVIQPNTTFRDPGFEQGDDHPVACVSWDDARAYVDWLNTQTPGGYRLLSEVEWEYVARAGAEE